MPMNIKSKFFAYRQLILRKIVPEFIWKKFISIDGVPIPLRNMPYSFGIKLQLTSGSYELSERILVSNIIERGMNVIEMGSSIGILSGIISQKIGMNGKLISVEASTKKYKISKSWLSKYFLNINFLNGYAFPCNEIPNNLIVEGFNDSINSLGGEVKFSQKAKNQTKNEKIDIDASNNLANYDISSIEKLFLKKSADLLVSDVEGAESVILQKDNPFPETLKFIIIELHPKKYESPDIAEKIIQKILNSNYSLIKRIDDSFLFKRLKGK